jgi:hypothetical protein
MDGKIFVGLSPRDPVEEIIPYLERLAKPGMTVVCLVRYPVERRDYLRDHWVTTDSTRSAIVAGRKLMGRYSWDAQRRLAEEKLAAVSRAMRKRAVKVEIDLYTGSLQRSVRDRRANGDVYWVMVPARRSLYFPRLRKSAITPFARFKWALCCSTAPAKTVVRPG